MSRKSIKQNRKGGMPSKEMIEFEKRQMEISLEKARWDRMILLRNQIREVMHRLNLLKMTDEELKKEGAISVVRPKDFIKSELESCYFALFAPRNGIIAELRRMKVSDSVILKQVMIALKGEVKDLPTEIMEANGANGISLDGLAERFYPGERDENKEEQTGA